MSIGNSWTENLRKLSLNCISKIHPSSIEVDFTFADLNVEFTDVARFITISKGIFQELTEAFFILRFTCPYKS